MKDIDTSKNMLVLTIKMRVFFANKENFIKQLQQNLESASEIYENKINISFDWNNHKREKRPLNSVYTNDNISDALKKDIQSFINSKNIYIQNNILYKRNYLLYGKPGTGKSSLIFALASELNFKIKIIDLKSITSVSDILYKISDADKTFYVFEDIDALSTTITEREEDKNNRVKDKQEGPRDIIAGKQIQGLNLSDILNVLDGLYTSEGSICFFTTNHIEKLDAAFLRDGRMDYKVEMRDLENKVANQMIKDKLGYKNLFKGNTINPATLQELIIQVIWGKLSIKEFEHKINSL
jgi:chaperone BCS1